MRNQYPRQPHQPGWNGPQQPGQPQPWGGPQRGWGAPPPQPPKAWNRIRPLTAALLGLVVGAGLVGAARVITTVSGSDAPGTFMLKGNSSSPTAWWPTATEAVPAPAATTTSAWAVPRPGT
ncbi:hypothetical protein C3492_35735 [Streptomyces sp. Ru62]|nr:hypothetical protein C3492_35735 [Streptomyces sp. Ru62]